MMLIFLSHGRVFSLQTAPKMLNQLPFCNFQASYEYYLNYQSYVHSGAMSTNPPNALITVPKANPPARRDNNGGNGFRLVNGDVHLGNRKDVQKRLPDILGKALALIWIDKEFNDQFSCDPQGTLSSHGVHLPENMVIEFQKPGTDRPRIVVYERRPNSKFKLRVFYLQLVMMAGR